MVKETNYELVKCLDQNGQNGIIFTALAVELSLNHSIKLRTPLKIIWDPLCVHTEIFDFLGTALHGPASV